MIDNRTASAIDQALQKHDTPVGPLFFVTRHGRTKKMPQPKNGNSLPGILYDHPRF